MQRRRTLLEQKQRLIHQLQMEKAELADRLREAANEKGKREAEALTERDATQAKLTAAVEQVQGKELELTTLRNDRERLQQQALMRPENGRGEDAGRGGAAAATARAA